MALVVHAQNLQFAGTQRCRGTCAVPGGLGEASMGLGRGHEGSRIGRPSLRHNGDDCARLLGELVLGQEGLCSRSGKIALISFRIVRGDANDADIRGALADRSAYIDAAGAVQRHIQNQYVWATAFEEAVMDRLRS